MIITGASYIIIYKGRYVKFQLRSTFQCRSKIDQNTLLRIVHGFHPKSENFDFGDKSYHRKGHLKRSILVQISAS